MSDPNDYDRLMWEALNEDIAHPLTAEVPVVPEPVPVVLPPLPNSEPAKPPVPEYAPPTASVALPVISPAPEPVAAPEPIIQSVQIPDEPVIDFVQLLCEPQTSSIVIDRERFPTGAIDLPPIEQVRPRTGAIKLPGNGLPTPATGVDLREASGTGPIDLVRPLSASSVAGKPKTGLKQRNKRQTTLAFVTAGLMMLVGGLFLAAYFLGYLR